MHPSPSRWVLAFDGTCANCRKISGAVAQACDGKLTVMPLSDERVSGRRELAFGAGAPWAPTLLRVDGASVRGWTGPAMAAPLLRRLRPRSTARTLRALEELRRQDARHTGRGRCAATTMWEEWGDTSRSHDHAFLGTVDDWLYQRVAGIEPAAPGYTKIKVQPYPVGDLTNASAHVESPLGRVSSA